MRKHTNEKDAFAHNLRLRDTPVPIPYMYCEDDYLTHFLNRPDIQKALNVESPVTWGICNSDINNHWDDSRNNDLAPLHKWIGENHAHVEGFKAMIMSGDNDGICSTLGTE